MHFFETELQLKSIENCLDAPRYLEEGGYSSAAYRHGIHLLFDFFPAGTLNQPTTQLELLLFV